MDAGICIDGFTLSLGTLSLGIGILFSLAPWLLKYDLIAVDTVCPSFALVTMFSGMTGSFPVLSSPTPLFTVMSPPALVGSELTYGGKGAADAGRGPEGVLEARGLSAGSPGVMVTLALGTGE